LRERERKRTKERGGEREGERERGREGERGREREGEGERERGKRNKGIEVLLLLDGVLAVSYAIGGVCLFFRHE
jgi:hypothetical protein